MATEQAPPHIVDRQLWQLPTFLLGLTALLGVAFGRDLWRPTPEVTFQRDLDALRQALTKIPPDLDEVESLRRDIEAQYQNFPGNEAEVHFLMGSAELVLAESLPEEDAHDLWQSARNALEEAETRGVDPKDHTLLRYRLGKVWEQSDSEPPEKVIEYLTEGLPISGNPAEGYRRLAEAYLRLPTPDLEQARDAYQQQLSRALHTPARVLTEARLGLSEVLTRLGEHDEARKVLDRITPETPSAYVDARLLLAQSYQADADWEEAILALEQAREVGGTADQRGAILYQLGWSYLNADQPSEAATVWGQARAMTNSYGRAAGLRLGEMMLRGPSAAAAVPLLKGAVDPLTHPGDYDNPLLPLAEARGIFEEAIQVYRLAEDFDSAQQVAQAYAHIAEAGRDRELFAETAEMWGQTLLNQAKEDVVHAEELTEEARRRFAEAAKGYADLATNRAGAGERTELIRRAASLYTKAGQRDEAVKLFDQLVDRDGISEEERAEMWYQIAEAQLAANEKEAAREAFVKAMAKPNPKLARARLQLARLKIESDDPAQVTEAIADLEANLAPEADVDAVTREYSLFTLATVLYLQSDYGLAAKRLEEALATYPKSALAIQGHYQLGRASTFLAAQESQAAQKVTSQASESVTPEIRDTLIQQRNEHLKRHRALLQQAAEHFQQVEAGLLPRFTASELPTGSTDAVLLRRASFELGQCRYFLRQYDSALKGYEELADRYAGQVEELVALSWVWQISKQYLDQPDLAKAEAAVQRMQEIFAKMKTEEDTARINAEAAGDPLPEPQYFNNSTKVHNRQYWENWFRQVEAVRQTSGG